MSWEELFTVWAEAPSKTEQDKSENAESAIRKAISSDPQLSEMSVTVFAQGSYRAHTNVKQDSDVDICVRLNSTFFADYPQGKTKEDFGNISSLVSYSDFKNWVLIALVNQFGAKAVTRGNKAIDIHENTYRLDADVVPTFEHRRYTGRFNADGTDHFHSGVAFTPDDGGLIKNWPAQNYSNGVLKNDKTSLRYKKVIRIVKRLRNKMQEDKIPQASDIASFLIECLIWNVPNEGFGHNEITADVRYILAHTFNETLADDKCSEWVEVNELKYLFRLSQPWTRVQAHAYLSAAWDYIGFK